MGPTVMGLPATDAAMVEFDPVAYINHPRWAHSRPGLDRIRALLQRMGNPQDRLKFVHVAGTNGKGSTCSYVASILESAGYRTGLFTSPYILEFAERIRVGGKNIDAASLRDVTLFVREHAEALYAEGAVGADGAQTVERGEHPTEFELMTAVAFEYFARSACDIVVCEVGLGGRLDSTNIIAAPEVCAITRIGLDHTGLLGETVGEIAREKAAIVKPGASVVAWPDGDEEVMRAIAFAAAFAGDEVLLPDFSRLEIGQGRDGVARRGFVYKGVDYKTKMLGSYQPYNAALALEVVRALTCRGWDIPEKAMQVGIADASWPGRFELVEESPVPFIVDGGHNPQGALALVDSLHDVFAGRKAVFLMGVLADKDYPEMVHAVLPLAKAFVCVTPPNSRALPADELAAFVSGEAQVECRAVGSFGEAVSLARSLASPEDVICAFGSLYSISDLMCALRCD